MKIKHLVVRGGYRAFCRVLPMLPKWPGEITLIRLLNTQLKEDLEEGEFDFLDGRVLEVTITDFHISLRIGKAGRRLVRAESAIAADATISANSTDFLGIAAGMEDPDTLFFQRRLSISGDTDFGLTAKNRLDAVDRQRLPQRVQQCLLLIAGALVEAPAN